EGTGSTSGVPDVPTDESEEEISWNSTNEKVMRMKERMVMVMMKEMMVMMVKKEMMMMTKNQEIRIVLMPSQKHLKTLMMKAMVKRI
nr:hypothetical protein [Tanacetum cinerariifolium]